MRIWIDVGRVFFSLCPFVPTWVPWENCAGMKGCGLSPFKVFSRFWSGSWSLFLIGSYGSEWSGHNLLSHPLSQPIWSAKRALQRQLNSCWCKARWLHYEDRFFCPKQDRWGCLFIAECFFVLSLSLKFAKIASLRPRMKFASFQAMNCKPQWHHSPQALVKWLLCNDF